MKYIVYITTNIINNKVYVGVHKTENPLIFDNYLGNAVFSNQPSSYNRRETPFQCAVAKYGPKNFKRTVLKVFDNEQDALDLERWIVCPEFINRKDTYNITLGGGKPPINSIEIYQYTTDGKLIKTWKSVAEVIKFYNINKDRLRMVIDEKRSMFNSYWTDEFQEELFNLYEYRPSARGCIRVYTVDGTFKGIYNSGKEACLAQNISLSDLSNHTRRKTPLDGYYYLKEGEKIEDFLSGKILQNPKIYLYDNNGDFIKEFKNISLVKKEFKYNKNDIIRAIKNNANYKNHYWSYDKYNNILKEDPTIIINIPRKVYQYTLEGDFVREWNSITECRKEFPSVLQVCLGNRNHCKKFKFSFDKLKIQSDTISNNGLTE